MTQSEVLELFKTDLGITHTARDSYFAELLTAAQQELARKGIDIDISTADTDDIFLLVDYAAWVYRNRLENVPLAQNLRLRIYNRKVRARATEGDADG